MQYTIHSRCITVFPTDTEAPCVWLNTFSQEAEAVWNACQALGSPPFTLAAIHMDNWNDDLSPWPSPTVFKGKDDFAGHADAYLKELTECIIPEITDMPAAKPSYHAIAGYSLAGLFAVYALYRTHLFARAACASGSFWFPGFLEFAASHDTLRKPDAVYLSLGDRECRTRNPVMAAVQERTQALHDLFAAQQIRTTFELNPGNHFQDPALRMAKGIRWMLR